MTSLIYLHVANITSYVPNFYVFAQVVLQAVAKPKKKKRILCLPWFWFMFVFRVDFIFCQTICLFKCISCTYVTLDEKTLNLFVRVMWFEFDYVRVWKTRIERVNSTKFLFSRSKKKEIANAIDFTWYMGRKTKDQHNLHSFSLSNTIHLLRVHVSHFI